MSISIDRLIQISHNLLALAGNPQIPNQPTCKKKKSYLFIISVRAISPSWDTNPQLYFFKAWQNLDLEGKIFMAIIIY